MSVLKTILYFAITFTCFIFLAAIYSFILALTLSISSVIRGFYRLKEIIFDDKGRWDHTPENRELSDVFISH